jgi:hypothetical protein
MHTQQAEGWTRRRFLGGLTVAGTVAVVGQHARAVANPSSSVIQEVADAGMESHGPPLDGPGDDHVASTAHFTLHSHPWVNLHHFLYQWARLEVARPAQRWPPSVDVPERGHIDALPALHRPPWQAALDLYRRQVIIRDLTSDRVLKRLRHRLIRMDRGDAEASPVLVSEVMGALRAVMPVYRTHWWGAHDASNRRWIAQILSLMPDTEAWLATRLAEVYGGPWPAEPSRVDLTAYASWHGAYTTGAQAPEPSHITISSTDLANQDGGALEILFHEASHVIASGIGPRGVEGPLEAALAAAYGARRETPPADLGHVIIFYSVGELTRQCLQARGRPGYEPYADRLGLYDRSLPWSAYRQALAKHWQPYLDGTIDRATALQRLVEELG